MIEKYNPWTVVNLVFRHLADEGLHPVLGEAGDPSAAAAELLAHPRDHARGPVVGRRPGRRAGPGGPRRGAGGVRLRSTTPVGALARSGRD